jgi:hypothetical protein
MSALQELLQAYGTAKLTVRYLLGVVVRHGSDATHLFQMLFGMIGVNHFVLSCGIIASKDVDGIATGMIKRENVVNDSVNDNLTPFQALQRANTIFRRSIILLFPSTTTDTTGQRLALSQLVGIGGHGDLAWLN